MKVVCVLWDELDRAERGRRLLDDLAPRLLEHSPRLTVAVADEAARMKSPSPFPLSGERPIGLVDLWPTGDPRVCIEILESGGFRVHAWTVEESIPSDYGDNEHASARDWADGERSPGVAIMSLLPRPKRLDREEWVRRWHSVMSPVSGRIQPRTRYVRNLFVEALTPDPPDYEGAVLECWPSKQHVSSPWLFYGASNPWRLVVNQIAIIRAVTHCFPLTRIPAVPMSEYFVRS